MWQVVGSPLGDKSRLGPLHVYTDTCICACMHKYTHIYMRTYLPHCQNVKGACITVQRADATGILLYSETNHAQQVQMNYQRSSLVSVRKLNGDDKKLSSSYQLYNLIHPLTTQPSILLGAGNSVLKEKVPTHRAASVGEETGNKQATVYGTVQLAPRWEPLIAMKVCLRITEASWRKLRAEGIQQRKGGACKEQASVFLGKENMVHKCPEASKNQES